MLALSTGWTPPANQDFNLDNYRKFTQEILSELNKEPKHTRFNLTKKERKAIKSLTTNSNIIIKPADKGEAIVIQNKCHKSPYSNVHMINFAKVYKAENSNISLTFKEP